MTFFFSSALFRDICRGGGGVWGCGECLSLSDIHSIIYGRSHGTIETCKRTSESISTVTSEFNAAHSVHQASSAPSSQLSGPKAPKRSREIIHNNCSRRQIQIQIGECEKTHGEKK